MGFTMFIYKVSKDLIFLPPIIFLKYSTVKEKHTVFKPHFGPTCEPSQIYKYIGILCLYFKYIVNLIKCRIVTMVFIFFYRGII